MQVLLGDVRGVYVWIETPPVQGEWTLTVDMVYFDGTKERVLGKHVKPGIRDWVNVEPNTRLEIHLSTKTTAVKLNRRFILSVSPVMYAVWPDFVPVPYRTIFD